ncbi:hypothetical protein [Actinomadura harenae]|uniref:hypothetical protein n=1 Tax=Actinomadura harenae TaxID=2483351 RepID=UPI0011C3A57E|nr:hypothetical protein [Actinomadura harenae]
MELRWRGVVTADYEMELDHGALVERDLYGRGLRAAPCVLLDDPRPLGRTRRPGVVDIDVEVYETFCERVRERLLTLQGAMHAATVFRDACAQVCSVLEQLERRLADGTPPVELAQLPALLDRLMALHTLNWLLPDREAVEHLTVLFGDEQAARRCALAQMVPIVPAHLLDLHQRLITTADTGNFTGFARAVGHLQAPGLAPAAWEDPAAVAVSVDTLRKRVGGSEGLAEQDDRIRRGRDRAVQQRVDLYAAALLASSGDASAWDRTQAIGVLFPLAADEEEERRRLQGWVLRVLRETAARHHVDAQTLTLDDFAALASGRGAERGRGC